LLTGPTGEVCFTALTRGVGFRGAGFAAALVFGFAGPPIEFGFIGAAMGVCFLTPPIELWAQAGRQNSPPNVAATMMMAIVLFFMADLQMCWSDLRGSGHDTAATRFDFIGNLLHCLRLHGRLLQQNLPTTEVA
jgi:hypothetical protein